ncbi:MAG: YifB family Mg chelatase-like AAA ATPase [Coriobacteriia bacterium]|nr:YifB family Mg chelatase-like AAA ATPase [Coriobacteriia bacterium]MCL2750635.1 YifB family Mg chelatase-like AAA ATPase [Coriobacteriia bacterium]
MSTEKVNNPNYIQTAAIIGVEAKPVTVEVSFTNSLPGISIVGMPDTAVSEARLRVRAALRATGFKVPRVHILVNLAPSDIPKIGSGFDLPIALGILLATEQISGEGVVDHLCIGELSLDGSVRPVRGMLAYEQLARALNICMLSAVSEQGIFSDMPDRHSCLESLEDLHVQSFQSPLPRQKVGRKTAHDYCDIAGNDLAKRALTAAAAGEHALMMIGPPGSGKTMLASRLPTIMDSLCEQERYESAMIHSIAGLSYDTILEGQKPFRSPHHSATKAGLLGGGSPVTPGEVTLAHNGILFLDEIPEFGSAVLQLLRQPIETGTVSLARARGTTVLPAKFMLIAASNPCPCGFFGDPERSCKCSDTEIRKYQARLGGPLLDRIDMVLDVWRSKPGEVLATGSGKSSADMRAQVMQAREYARWRAEEQGLLPGKDAVAYGSAEHTKKKRGRVSTESTVGAENTGESADSSSALFTGEGALLLRACELGKSERFCLEEASEKLKLSGRGIMRALSVARTLADLEQSRKVQSDHILEALTFRAEGRCGDE